MRLVAQSLGLGDGENALVDPTGDEIRLGSGASGGADDRGVRADGPIVRSA